MVSSSGCSASREKIVLPDATRGLEHGLVSCGGNEAGDDEEGVAHLASEVQDGVPLLVLFIQHVLFVKLLQMIDQNQQHLKLVILNREMKGTLSSGCYFLDRIRARNEQFVHNTSSTFDCRIVKGNSSLLAPLQT